jgi:diguanylate cyclase (GGDEF)-like protein
MHMGKHSYRFPIGNLFLSAGCVLRICADQWQDTFLYGFASLSIVVGLSAHLSGFRFLVSIKSLDKHLVALTLGFIVTLLPFGESAHFGQIMSGLTYLCTGVIAALSASSSLALKNKTSQPLKWLMLTAFCGLGTVSALNGIIRLSYWNSPPDYQAISLSLFGLAVFLVLINLGYIVLFLLGQQQKITHMAQNDSLTCVLNRRGLEEHLAKLANSNGGRLSGSVLLLDVDRFKTINDTLGHSCGDAVLRDLGECLRRHLRTNDMVGRVGGEEFILVLPNTNGAAAQIIAERLRIELSERQINTSATTTISITVSIGVAEFDMENPSLDAMLQRSDAALYTAKANGRNRTELWSPKLELLLRAMRVKPSVTANSELSTGQLQSVA